MQNFFEMFDLSVSFALDRAALDAAFRKVQAMTHPDRFVSSTASEKRVAMQWATRANEAWQTLSDPARRATYMCELAGADIGAESNTSMSGTFLMQQMAWREQFDDVRQSSSLPALTALIAEIDVEREQVLARIGAAFDAGLPTDAALQVRQLMFLDKILGECRQFRQRMAA